jgi:transposase-like protein
MFHRSHVPLRQWFRAIWWVTTQKPGVSALGLQRSLGLGSYRTAWLLLHKVRHAMVRPGREPLTGEVEVDEAFVGGQEPGVHGRETYTKALVAIAAEIRGGGTGRIRLQHVSDASQAILTAFVRSAVAKGAVVRTDGWGGYAALGEAGYRHRSRVPPPGDRAATTRLLPRVHRVASLLKRWLLGTHQGGLRRKHLQAYLDEFEFRFNRRTSRWRGQLFARVLEHAIQLPPTPYRQVLRGRIHKI